MAGKKIVSSPSAHDYQLLIKNLITTPVIYYPDQEIVYKDRARYTYRQFERRVAQLANVLENHGVNRGSTVAVMDWDSHRYLECFFAVPMMEAVLHTINIRLTPEQLAYTINHAKDDIILVHRDFVSLLEDIQDRLHTVKKYILIADDEPEPESNIEFSGEYEQLMAGSHQTYDWREFDENTMATLFYTTGTTGLPKGVYFSHRQLVLHTYGLFTTMSAFNAQAAIDAGDVYMPLTPMFHVHAWGLPYLFTLMGAKQIYPGRYEPELLLALYRKHGVTFSHCVPTILHMLLNSPSAKNIDFSGWNLIIGGAALPNGLCLAAMELGINIYSAYGMSETCPLVAMALLKPDMLKWPAEKQVEYRTKSGLPAPGAAIRIVDSDGNNVAQDGESPGEIIVRAPWLTQGYLDDAKKSEELWKDGWLHTGDVAVIDSQGYIKVTDRIKDVIKTGGEWVSSLELENIISQHTAVSEVAVVGIKDPKWGERPLAVIVKKDDNEVDATDLKNFVAKFVKKGVIPKYGAPDRYVFVDKIPKTSVGKLDKKVMRETYKQ